MNHSHMSLVVEAPSSSLTTATSTTGDLGIDDLPFLVAQGLPPLSSCHRFTPIKSADHLALRFISHQRSPAAGSLSRTPSTRSHSVDKDPSSPEGGRSEISTPVKKVAKRLIDFDILDSNSRDSGFDSEGSRFSCCLSTASINSNPGTPASSSSVLSVSTGLIGNGNDDSLSGLAEELHSRTGDSANSSRLCFWDTCDDPELLSEEYGNKKDLLGHILARHVQPLEYNKEKKHSDKPACFKCMWRGCKVYGKGSKLYSWLEGHVVERHGGPRPFFCPLPGCLQRFGSKSSAERHINSHFVDDEQPFKESRPCATAHSNFANKPSTISPLSALRGREIEKSTPSGQRQQRNLVGTRSSKKRHFHEEEIDDFRTRNRRAADKASAKNCSNTASHPRGMKETELKRSPRLRKDIKDAVCLRQNNKGRNGCDTKSKLRKARHCDEVEGKQSSRGRTTTKQATSTRDGQLCSANGSKKVVADFWDDFGRNKATLDPASSLSTVGSVSSAAKRKANRAKYVPEDAFDAMYARTVRVLAARCVLSSMRNGDVGGNNKKQQPLSSCHKCSGISTHADRSSSCHSQTNCICSDHITFHAKVLAKRTSNNGKKDADGSSLDTQCQLFCSWTPVGLLPQKWIDESSFQPTVCLPRSLFPSLARESSTSSTGSPRKNGLCLS